MENNEQKCREVMEAYQKAAFHLTEAERLFAHGEKDLANEQLDAGEAILDSQSWLFYEKELKKLESDYQESKKALEFYKLTENADPYPSWSEVAARLKPYMRKIREIAEAGLQPRMQITPTGTTLKVLEKAFNKVKRSVRVFNVESDEKLLRYGPDGQTKAGWSAANHGYLIDIIPDKIQAADKRIERVEDTEKRFKEEGFTPMYYENLMFASMCFLMRGDYKEDNVNKLVLGQTFDGKPAFWLWGNDYIQLRGSRKGEGIWPTALLAIPYSVRVG